MSDVKLKVIQIIDSISFGGREKVVIDLCNNLNFEKFDVYLLTLSNDNNVLKDQIHKNVTIIEVPCKYKHLEGMWVPYFWIIAFPYIFNIIRKFKPEIIQIHLQYHKILLIALALRLSFIPTKLFITIHTSGLYYISKKLIDRFRLFIEQLSVSISKAHLIGISEIVHKNNNKYFGTKSRHCSYVPNGVDLTRFSKKLNVRKEDFEFSSSDVLVVYVGRFDEGKNHLTLLNAWTIVQKDYGDKLKLLLIGDGVLRDSLLKFIQEHHLGNTIKLTGNISNVQDYLAICDFAVIPSSFEGFPLTMIEKMAMKLPVLASSIDIFNFMIKDGYNGYIFPTYDYKKLAELIIYLANNKDLIEELGINAFKTALGFSLDKTIQIYESLYLNEINEKFPC